MAPTKRKSYTISEKLKIVTQRHASQISGRKFALSVGISETTLRDWMSQEDALKLQSSSSSVNVRKARHLPRKRIGYFPQVDAKVLEWILDRNRKGIRIKDKFIQMRALQVKEELLAQHEDAALKVFQASKLWCHRFKKRNNLKARRHTTSHRLPLNFREQVITFIKSVHELCSAHDIQREHIINLDQVPRYYECDNRTTITTKGSKEVLLGKIGSGHKRFTYTPFIDASGRVLIKHALFSKLKNIPKHHQQCRVSVTGMWNESILKQYVDEAVRISRGIFGTGRSVLIVLDSYGVHIKFVRLNTEYYSERNVFFAVIPPGLTGILQPLDVALNRPFQQYFDDQTNEYQSEVLQGNENRTPRGNVKMPSTELITSWVVGFCDTLTPEAVSKSFDLCGLVPAGEFRPENLHKPLRDIYDRNITVETWLQEHSTILETAQLEVGDSWQVFTGKFAFLRALFSLIDSSTKVEDWISDFVEKILMHLNTDPLTKPLLTDEDKSLIKEGLYFTQGNFEAYAAAEILKSHFHLILLEEPIQRLVFGLHNDNTPVGFYFKKTPLTVFVPADYNQEDLCFVEQSEPATGSGSESEGGENDDHIEEEHLYEFIDEQEAIDGNGELHEEPHEENNNGIENIMEQEEQQQDDEPDQGIVLFEENIQVD